MANITGKLDEVIAKVKDELGEFLSNQSVLISLRSSIRGIGASKPDVAAQLSAKNEALYAKQSTIEAKAMDWMSRMAELKAAIMSNPDIAGAMSTGTISPAMFTGGFWAQITSYTNAALPLISEGLAVSSQLVTQNGEVALLKQSVQQGVVLVPATKTVALNQGLIWAYGALGLGLAYLVATKKKRSQYGPR